MKIKPIYIIALFLLLLIIGFCRESKAEVSIEAGPTFLSDSRSHGGVLLLSERFGKYDFGLGYVSEQNVNVPCGSPLARSVRCDYDIRENIFVSAQRIVTFNRCELGIGPAYFSNTNRALGKQFTIGLSAGCHISKKLSLVIRHYSNAGSGTPNLGQDALMIRYSFK